MRCLRDFNSFNRYFDIDSNTILTLSNVDNIIGWFNPATEKISGIYVLNNNMYFQYGEESFLIDLTFFAETYIGSDKPNHLIFNLYENNVVVAQFGYYKSQDDSKITPFEYLDENDFNWGEFLKEKINSDVKRNSFIKNLMPFE